MTVTMTRKGITNTTSHGRFDSLADQLLAALASPPRRREGKLAGDPRPLSLDSDNDEGVAPVAAPVAAPKTQQAVPRKAAPAKSGGSKKKSAPVPQHKDIASFFTKQ